MATELLPGLELPKPLRFSYLANTKPEPLDFIFDGFAKGTVGALVGPGGTGKSMFALELAIQIAGGPNLLGFDAPKGRVVYLSAEDPPLPLHHRLHSISQHLSEEEVATVDKNFILQPAHGLAHDLMDQRWIEGLAETCRKSRLVIIDTLRRFHVEEENSSGQMMRVMSVLESAAMQGAGILVLHHVSKASRPEGSRDQHAARGSSVVTDHARWQGSLTHMSDEEASAHHIEDECRWQYARFGSSKQNYGPPTAPRWYRRNEHGLLLPVNFDDEQQQEGRAR